jgi:hypothetical protein
MAVRLDSTVLSSDSNVQKFLFNSREHLLPAAAAPESRKDVIEGVLDNDIVFVIYWFF